MNKAVSHDASLILERTYQASLLLVWEAWTDASHVSAWWGPFGPDQTHAEIELVVGGMFYVGMQAPDGSEHPCRGKITEIKPLQRIVIEGHTDAPDACGAGLPPNAVVTIDFSEQQDGTKVSMHAQFDSRASMQAATSANWTINGANTLDQLAEYIARNMKEKEKSL